MRFGSLFAGIGGIDLGLERVGMECAWQVEVDEFCQKVLQKHWPDVPKYGDIRDVGKHNLETVDLIAGGFPCQPFSVAGKRRGAEDDRHLWPEMLRVISELKPTWVLGENVPGIIPLFLDQAISDLEGEGYTTEQFTIPACAFDAPHRRDRLFIIANNSRARTRLESGWRGRGDGQGRESPNSSESAMVRQENRKGSSERLEASNRFGVVGYPKHDGRHETEVSRSLAQGSNGSKARKSSASELERPSGQCEAMAHSTDKGLQRKSVRQARELQLAEGSRWATEPELGRVAHGIPDRVDRLKSLGNAVVPQVAEHIGRMILRAEKIMRIQDE